MLSALPSVRLVDLVDIALVAFIIYGVLLFIRGTRAVQILSGLLLVLGMFVVARRLGMVTFQWIVGNFLGYLIVILVVIFQAEIRRGLAKMGQSRIFGRMPPAPAPGFLEAIARSAFALSAARTGAILLFERTMRIEEHFEHATRIDAEFSHELLASILSPASPIHDGAVIVRGERIAAARVFLPFAGEPLAGGTMGTRHRAAVGVAAETDAIAIVVSEETGNVTVFHDRAMEPMLDETQLAATLRGLLQREGEGDARPL